MDPNKNQLPCVGNDFSMKLPSELARTSISTTSSGCKEDTCISTNGDKHPHSYQSLALEICFSREATGEKLRQVISERYHYGFLMPYNYSAAFSSLKRKMVAIDFPDHAVSIVSSLIDEDCFMSKRRQAQFSSVIDPVDVEVSLYRMLLEYDRYLCSMTIPTALWRRSGQILRTNSSFLKLIGGGIQETPAPPLDLLDVFCERTFLNYLRRYISVAYDLEQRTVLTCAFLKKPKQENASPIPCSFSFTIRRDIHDVPCLVVGQFIPVL